MTSAVMKTCELIGWGHDVTRWHAMPNIKQQTLASHSWAVAMIVVSLFPGNHDEKLLLVQAALEHDLVEKHIGDMPRPGRTQEHRDLEAEKARELEVFHESLLPPHLQDWLEWADLLEAGMHALREVELGNTRFREVLARIDQYIAEKEDKIPEVLLNFAIEAGLYEAEEV